MIKKLSLTLEDSVIASAKKYARKNGKSLSVIVEDYLKYISTQEDNIPKSSPKVSALLGCVKLPDDFDYKKELHGRPL
jgi:hypothetical protein